MLVFELIENIIVQDTSSRRVEEDKKNLKEKKEYKKKYLNSKLESCQQSLKRYKLAGKICVKYVFILLNICPYYFSRPT